MNIVSIINNVIVLINSIHPTVVNVLVKTNRVVVFAYTTLSHINQDTHSCGQVQTVRARDRQVCILQEPGKAVFTHP